MTSQSAAAARTFDAAYSARQFVDARLSGTALPDFPGGVIPADMASGYACQEAAIGMWPDEVAGWKVGRIPAELQAELGADRVCGPVFRANVWQAGSAPIVLPVIPGGFAAVEAEYIFRIGEDAPAGKTEWTPDEALSIVEEELVGVEFAGSPLKTINVLGPRVVASDFGNNAGLILGKPIPDWRARNDDWPACETFIEGVSVGTGAPSSIPGSPAHSLAFLLGACAARGRPLTRGQLVTTGAATGIHDIEAGQTARITFSGLDEIVCIAQLRRPAEGQGGKTNEQHNDLGRR